MANRAKSVGRREFLQMSAAASAAALVPKVWAAAPKRAIRLGMASYTLRSFDRAQVIADMKALKLTLLNAKDVKDHLPADAAGEAAAVKDYVAAGLTLTAVGTVAFPKDEDDDIRAKFEYAKRAGVKVIVAGDPAPATLLRLEKFVKEYDIRLAIHNHGPEDKLWPSPLDIFAAVKNMDRRMGCCVDVGHAMRTGIDVVAAIRTVGARVFDVHMKDLADAKLKESQVAVGKGVIPVRGIFQALLEIGYAGNVDLEYEIFADNPMPGVTESFAFMRKTLAEMGV